MWLLTLLESESGRSRASRCRRCQEGKSCSGGRAIVTSCVLSSTAMSICICHFVTLALVQVNVKSSLSRGDESLQSVPCSISRILLSTPPISTSCSSLTDCLTFPLTPVTPQQFLLSLFHDAASSSPYEKSHTFGSEWEEVCLLLIFQ